MPVNISWPDTELLGSLGVFRTSNEAEIWFAYFTKVIEHLKGRVKDVQDCEAGSTLVDAGRGLIENIERIKARYQHLLERVIEESSNDARLMKLTEAYQVLSDPERREAYLNYGIRPASLVHYSVILQMVFGSVPFRDYVGTMKLDSLADVIEAGDPLDTTKDQMQRVLIANAKLLKEKVPYLVGVMNRILGLSSNSMRREEAQRLSQGNTAPPRVISEMLKTIGPIYQSNAAKLCQKNVTLWEVCRRVSSRLLSRLKMQAHPQGYSTCQKEATLWQVCRKVLADLTDREKKKRAKKLQEFGQILEEIGERMG